MQPHEALEKRQTVHARHLNVQGEDVGVERLDFFAGDVGILRRTHHFQIVVALDELGQHLAHQRRVIHDKDPDGYAHLKRSASPLTGSCSRCFA